MTITNDDLARTTQKMGSHRHLDDLLNDRHGPDIAFFELLNGREVFYATARPDALLSPVALLFMSGVHIRNDLGRVYRNYRHLTDTDRGVIDLCAGNNFQDAGDRPTDRLRDIVEDVKRSRFTHIRSSGLPNLLRGDFRLYGAAAPNVDVTRENPSNPNAHDGFHTVHRIYMATVFRILRSYQIAGSREGVAALVVDGTTGAVLSWGVKNPAHPMLHAEFSAILAHGDRLPANARIYSTLKPCKMCAGLIHDKSRGNHRVFFGQSDPGNAAQNTALDADRSGRLLDGRRNVAGVRGIVPIYHDGTRSNRSLAEMLDDDFRDSGLQSVIDFGASDAARDAYHRSDRMLERKIQKYAAANRNDKNSNVWSVLSYLTGFLDRIGVNTPQLAGPG